ncbi:FAD-binding protein [Novosphingobium sp. 1949]|uniref:FAD-binding protein n=1 Tax=Novosphingobium organovorum TaxID=2930092 RepID=A0ABT0BII0_9SPHN|nr:FAD-dependent oxidoreductase [Novosphingobium organovorum]MCJ2184529.1 FAD-binding protein [Novosphingobium organovorum]
MTHDSRTTDVLVLGAGAGGLAAALTLAIAGKRVLVLEKTPVTGGRANYAEGVFGVETEMQRENWVNLKRDETYREEMEETRWSANAPLVRRFHNKSADTIEWLQQQGVEFEGPETIEWTANRTWHIAKGHGKQLCKVLFERLETFPNAELIRNISAKELLTDETGRVTGARAFTAEGDELVVHAGDGVIVATGGFANNPEMMAKYTEAPDPVQYAPIGSEGDGITMVHALGADLDSIAATMLLPALDQHVKKMGWEQMNLCILGWQPRGVWVDLQGERFTAEDVAVDFIHAGNAVHRVKHSWTILDGAERDYLMTKGLDVGLGVLVPATTKVGDFDKFIDYGLANCEGAVVVADGIEDLARQTGLPLAQLEQTLATYNEDVARNKDSGFAKDERYLTRIETTGKLYGLRMTYGILTTVGGIRINKYLQPVRPDATVIQGVYVVGNDAGGISARDSYTLGAASGTSFGFAVNGGRMAAQQIIGEEALPAAIAAE